jgi:hypothetical protein
MVFKVKAVLPLGGRHRSEPGENRTTLVDLLGALLA